MKRFFLAACAVTIAAAGGPARAQTVANIVSHTDLRVCADPHDLPLSNQQGQGYENKIAALMAKAMHLHLTYTWYPDSEGFVRSTLMKDRCDLIIGTVAGGEGVSTTDPYYHTGYMMVTRLGDHYDGDKISDWRIAGKRFGLVAGTPPMALIVQHNLLDQVSYYNLMVDTRVDQPAHDMLKDLVAGRIDIGLLWGPFAGYFIKHDHLKLRAVFIDPEDSKVRLDYHIAMGVRSSDVDFRRQLNRVIEQNLPQITRILQDYGIPLLDEENHPIPVSADSAATPAP